MGMIIWKRLSLRTKWVNSQLITSNLVTWASSRTLLHTGHCLSIYTRGTMSEAFLLPDSNHSQSKCRPSVVQVSSKCLVLLSWGLSEQHSLHRGLCVSPNHHNTTPLLGQTPRRSTNSLSAKFLLPCPGKCVSSFGLLCFTELVEITMSRTI